MVGRNRQEFSLDTVQKGAFPRVRTCDFAEMKMRVAGVGERPETAISDRLHLY